MSPTLLSIQKGKNMMAKLVSKRVAKLGALYHVGPPSKEDELLMARIEAGLRRVAALRGSDDPPIDHEPPRRDVRGLPVVEILHAGRARTAQLG